MLGTELFHERRESRNLGKVIETGLRRMLQVADDVIARTSDPAALGLKLREGELLIHHSGADALREIAENLDPGFNDRLLPGEIFRVELRTGRLHDRRDIEAGVERRLQQGAELRGHRAEIDVIHATQRVQVLVGLDDFLERQIAKPHRFAERERDVGNAHPEIGNFAIEKNFAVRVPALDILKTEAAQEVMQGLAVLAEARGFAGEAVKADQGNLVAGRLDRALDIIGLLQPAGEIVGERDLEQILGAAVLAIGEDFVRATRGAIKVAEAVENLHRRDSHLVAGIGEEFGFNGGKGFVVEAEVEEGEGFFEFGFRVAKDHFQESHCADRIFGRFTLG